MVEHAVIAQNFPGNGQAVLSLGRVGDDAPVGAQKTMQPSEVDGQLFFCRRGEYQTVDQKHQGYRQEDIEDPQLDSGSGAHTHGGQCQRVAGGKDRMIPGAGSGAVHHGQHEEGEDKACGGSREQRAHDGFHQAS